MTWTTLALAIVIAVVAASLVDWLFAGVLFHDKYMVYPEVWRNPRGGPGESRAVGKSAAISILTPLVFVLLAARLHLGTSDTFLLAFAIWLMAPLPFYVTQQLFMRLHPAISAAHAAGWLVKLLVCAATAGWFL